MSDTDQEPNVADFDDALARAFANVERARPDGLDENIRKNGHARQYVTLASVDAACRKALTDELFSYPQLPSTRMLESGEMMLDITTQLRRRGVMITSTLTLPVLGKMRKGGDTFAPPTAQSVGSALTYGRRYALTALVGVCPDDDDDGHAASTPEADPIWDRFAFARDRMVRVLGVTEDKALEMAAVAARVTLQKGKNETDAELVAMTKSADMLLGAAERKAELEAKHKSAKTAYTVAGRKWMTTQRADYKDAEGEKASPDAEESMRARAGDISARAAQVDKWPGLRDATTEQLEAAADALRADLAGPGDPDA